MFCPLMKRFKNHSMMVLAAGFLLAAVSTASAESVPVESASLPVMNAIVSPILPEVGAPRNELTPPAAVPVQAPPAAPAVPQAAERSEYRHPVIVLEAPERVSFDQLRREAARYPDHSMSGRFVELSTQLPPLFDTDA